MMKKIIKKQVEVAKIIQDIIKIPVRFKNMKRMIGYAEHLPYIPLNITISNYMLTCSDNDIQDLVLHEISHLITCLEQGISTNHKDKIFVKTCKTLGCNHNPTISYKGFTKFQQVKFPVKKY